MGIKVLQFKLTRWLVGASLGLGLFAVPAFAAAATMSLSPTTGSFAAGTTFDVKIQVDTNGATTSGTDAYVRFDPNVLQVVDANASLDGVQVQAGTLYSQTSYNKTDNSLGKVSFSGSKSGGSPGFAGTGTLATIRFQAAKEVTASAVTFDFTKGSTTDSNVIDQTSSNDVLNSVTNATFTVTPAVATATTTTTGTTGTTTTTTTGTGSGATTDTTGAAGTTGTTGVGGSTAVAKTGLDLRGYFLLTLLTLFGAGYFLRPKRHARR